MDVSETLVAKSDQLDAIDLLASGPRVFTIEKVSKGNSEQPLNIKLKEFPRAWRPGKNMRRVLSYCYTTDATKWEGKRVLLFCDETVRFGGETVAGSRISHLSDIDGPQDAPVILGKGKSGKYRVLPLTPDVQIEALRREWRTAEPDRKTAIEAEVQRLQTSGSGESPGAEPRQQSVENPPSPESEQTAMEVE